MWNTSKLALPHFTNRKGDDFDDQCSPYASSFDWTDACSYVRKYGAECEGGGFIPWTRLVVCQPSHALEAIGMVLSALWLAQLFVLLATSADGYLATSIAAVSARWNLSQTVAGVTLVAFGNGSPDIFSVLASAISDESPKAGLAFGELLGGGMFITTIVVPTIIMIRPFRLDPVTTLRNLCFYLVALAWLGLIMFSSGKLKIWQPVGFLLIYACYALTVVSARMMVRLQKWRESKNLIFVKPAKPHQSVSCVSAHLERYNTVQPLVGQTSIANDMSANSQGPDLPCQEKNCSAIFNDLFSHLWIFDCSQFWDANLYIKIFLISRAPCDVLLRLSVPLAQMSWCKFLAIVHCYLAPLVVLFGFQLYSTHLPYEVPAWILSLSLSSLIALFILGFTSVSTEPAHYKTISCHVGFVTSVAWIYTVAAEVVDVVQMLGVISHLSPEILGVTVLGWTNSIGDLVADVSLARQGLSQMAMAAAFGGPLFNLLIGFGLSFTLALLQGKTVYIEMDASKILMYGFTCASVSTSLVLLVLQRFHARKCYAVWLYTVYAAFMVMLIIAESEMLDF